MSIQRRTVFLKNIGADTIQLRDRMAIQIQKAFRKITQYRMVELSDLHFLMITAKMKVIDKKSYVNESLTTKLNNSVEIAGT